MGLPNWSHGATTFKAGQGIPKHTEAVVTPGDGLDHAPARDNPPTDTATPEPPASLTPSSVLGRKNLPAIQAAPRM